MIQYRKLVFEFGPLALFFAINALYGIYAGTAAIAAATLAALAASWLSTRSIAVMPLMSAGAVLLFGGLTLWLRDDLFIKLKPTIVNLIFAAAIFIALPLKRNVLKLIFAGAFQLDEQAWRTFAVRWGFFFLALALLNEIVWRTVSTDAWVAFKVFGIMPLTLLFSLSQAPFLLRRQTEAASGEDLP